MTASPESLDAQIGEPERALVRGVDLAYWRKGHGGVPLLLVHGWPSTRRIWLHNVRDLAGRGFDVVVPDLRGFGDSDCGANGLHDVVAHSLDMASLLGEHLGLGRAVAVGGDLGAAVVQDMSLRFPALVDRLVIFDGPLPTIHGQMDHLPPDTRRFEDSHAFRPATDPDGLMAELVTPEARVSYVASHYRSWSPPGAFTEAEIDYLAAPFADPAKLRASFGTYESLIDPSKRTGRSMIASNHAPTLIIEATADPCRYPAFGRRAAIVFARHVGPIGMVDAGHFPQWEQPELMNDAIAMFCTDRLGAQSWSLRIYPADGRDHDRPHYVVDDSHQEAPGGR